MTYQRRNYVSMTIQACRLQGGVARKLLVHLRAKKTSIAPAAFTSQPGINGLANADAGDR